MSGLDLDALEALSDEATPGWTAWRETWRSASPPLPEQLHQADERQHATQGDDAQRDDEQLG